MFVFVFVRLCLSGGHLVDFLVLFGASFDMYFFTLKKLVDGDARQAGYFFRVDIVEH